MAPIESVASVIDLTLGKKMRVKVKVIARMDESISTVKIIIEPLFNQFTIYNSSLLIVY